MSSQDLLQYKNLVAEVKGVRDEYLALKKSHEGREEYLATLKSAIDATESGAKLVVKRNPDESDIEAFLNLLSKPSAHRNQAPSHLATF